MAAMSGFSITVTCGGVAEPCSEPAPPIAAPVLEARRVERCDIKPPPAPCFVPLDASAAFAAAVRLLKRLVGSPVLTYHPPSGASSSESEAGIILESARCGDGGRGGAGTGEGVAFLSRDVLLWMLDPRRRRELVLLGSATMGGANDEAPYGGCCFDDVGETGLAEDPTPVDLDRTGS